MDAMERMRDDVRLIAEGQEALREEIRITRLEASGARGRVRKNR